MKKLLAVAVLATTTAAFAAADRAIYDVQYLPNAGTTYGQTEWSFAKAEVEADSGDEDIDGWVLTQTVGHAFTDRLSVQASLNYADLTSDPQGGSETDFANGISDPTITARWRAMDEAWRLDVIGGALISLGDKENDNGDLNNYEGGHDLFLGAQIGQRSDKMQWAVLGQYTHHMEATTDVKGGQEIDADAHGDWTLRADLLNKFSEKSFLRSHLTGMWTPKYDTEQGTTEDSEASSAMWELGTQYQHLFSQDLLAFAGVDYRTTSEDTSDQDSNTAWIYTIGARYQF